MDSYLRTSDLETSGMKSPQRGFQYDQELKRSLTSSDVGISQFKEMLETRRKQALQNESTSEETIGIIRQQISHIDQIKHDNDQKRKIIKELHDRCEHLLGFKERSLAAEEDLRQTRESLRNAEGQLHRLRVESMSMQNRTQVEGAKLKRTLTDTNDQMVHMKHETSRKIQSLTSELENSRRAFDRAVSTNDELQATVAKLQRLCEQQREEKHNASIQQQDVVNTIKLENTKSLEENKDLKNTIQDLEAKVRTTSQDNIMQADEIGHLKSELNKVERQKLELNQQINRCNQQLEQQEKENDHLVAENRRIPNLEKELEAIPILRGENEHLQRQVRILTSDIDEAKVENSRLREKIAHADQSYQELQHHADDLIKNNTGYKRQIETLKEVEATKIYLAKQLDHFKEENATLQSQQSAAALAAEHQKVDLSQSKEHVQVDLLNLQKLMDDILSGGSLQDSLYDVKFHDHQSLGQLTTTLAGLKGTIIESARTVEKTRRQLKELLEEHASVSTKLNRKEAELDNAMQKIMAITDQMDEHTTVIKNTMDERDQLSKSYEQLQIEHHQLKSDMALRKEYIRSLFDSLAAMTGIAFSSLDGTSWESESLQLSNVVHDTKTKLDTTEKELKMANHKVRDLTMELQKAKDEIQDTIQTMDHQKEEMEAFKNEELAAQAAELENQKQAIVEELTAQRNDVEAELKEANYQLETLQLNKQKLDVMNATLSKDLEECTMHRQRLYNCLLLLSRGVRPLRERVQSLEHQKVALQSQVNHGELKCRQIAQLVKSLQSEFKGNKDVEHRLNHFDIHVRPPKKYTLRSVAIAIIAGHRLQKLYDQGKRRNHQGKFQRKLYGRAGSNVIVLLPKDEVSIPSIHDLPACENEHLALEQFVELIEKLDAHMESLRTRYDPRMMTALHDGIEFGNLLSNPQERVSSPTQLVDQVKVTTETAAHILRELQRQRNALKQKADNQEGLVSRQEQQLADYKENHDKKDELIRAMDSRLQAVKFEKSQMVDPNRYTQLETENARLQSDHGSLQVTTDRLKSELREYVATMNRLRSESTSLNDTVRDLSFRNEQLKKEVDNKAVEIGNLATQVQRQNDELTEVSEEKKKYQTLVTQLTTESMLQESTNSRSIMTTTQSGFAVNSPYKKSSSNPSGTRVHFADDPSMMESLSIKDQLSSFPDFSASSSFRRSSFNHGSSLNSSLNQSTRHQNSLLNASTLSASERRQKEMDQLQEQIMLSELNIQKMNTDSAWSSTKYSSPLRK